MKTLLIALAALASMSVAVQAAPKALQNKCFPPYYSDGHGGCVRIGLNG